MISQSSNYAIKALVFLSQEGMSGIKDEETFFRVKEISKKIKVPSHYLGKILQKLAKHKFVTSSTGPRGGYALAKKSADINLLDIIVAIEGKSILNKCFFGRDNCAQDECPMHKMWGQIRKKLSKHLSEISMTDIIKLKSWDKLYK